MYNSPKMVESQSELEGNPTLPRGRHGLTAEEVADHQRQRIAAAIALVVAEDGYGALTVERVIAGAGISRSTFYAHFTNKQEAVVAAHELIFERFLATLVATCKAEAEWPMKVRAAVDVAVDFATGRPEQSLILSVGSLTADPVLAESIYQSHERLASLLGGIRLDSPYASQLPDCTEQFLVLAVGAVIANRLVNGEGESLRSVQGELVELTLLPYYGREEAKRLAHLPG